LLINGVDRSSEGTICVICPEWWGWRLVSCIISSIERGRREAEGKEVEKEIVTDPTGKNATLSGVGVSERLKKYMPCIHMPWMIT
jgi:hypothetical protein